MSKCLFCLIDYNCIIILLSVNVFVCHDKGNVFFCKINSPVYVYWKQQKYYIIVIPYSITFLRIKLIDCKYLRINGRAS